MKDYIRCGDVVRFVNGYQGGSYLGAGAGSAITFLIDSNANDNPGLVAGDRLHLLNDFNNGTGFLDTRNHASPGSGFLFNVSASYFYNRDAGSGTWQIVRA
ncbi:hypothetical protein [Burkholderia ubonensis]|uniref:hypothetical protein n=1 Tax=Burkholderia ubonensis TaxID=101571 RepID=UPI0012FBB0F5|nr:hypothetical protein [Burkholderia ubonensis]